MSKRITVPDSPEAIAGVSMADMIAKAVQAAIGSAPAVAVAPSAPSAPSSTPTIAVATAPRAPKTEAPRKEKLYKVCNLSDGRTIDAVLYCDPDRKVYGCIGLRGLRGASEWSDLVLSAATWKLLVAVMPHVSPIVDRLASEAEGMRNGKKK